MRTRYHRRTVRRAGVVRTATADGRGGTLPVMTDPEYDAVRQRAARGDPDAVDELVELAGERGDLAELRRLADAGHRDAADELVQAATELGDLDELRSLASAGNSDAADVLAELTED